MRAQVSSGVHTRTQSGRYWVVLSLQVRRQCLLPVVSHAACICNSILVDSSFCDRSSVDPCPMRLDIVCVSCVLRQNRNPSVRFVAAEISSVFRQQRLFCRRPNRFAPSSTSATAAGACLLCAKASASASPFIFRCRRCLPSCVLHLQMKRCGVLVWSPRLAP